MADTGRSRVPWLALSLAGLLTVTGILHFASPGTFDGIIPGWLPGSARAYTLVSGAAELAVAGLLYLPRTRRLGGTVAAVLFIVVFPANIVSVVHARTAPGLALAIARLPVQLPLVLWALAVRHGGSRRTPSDSGPLSPPTTGVIGAP